ncbi:sensor histidine kinase [Nocardiopsis mangrovi]|uniref:Sensor histidine kinase n=1 Tax=Nocardiopsis mangrovi TaxID=1179818 RepID=A0ABV9DYH2_9ACTN
MTSENAEATPGQLRVVNRGIVHASITAVGSLLVVNDAHNWWQGVILALGVVAALVAVSWWATERFWHAILPCLVVTAAVWVAGVLVASSPTAVFGYAVVVTVIHYQSPRHRTAAILGTAALVAAVVAAKLVVSDDGVLEVLRQYVIVSGGNAVAAVVFTSLYKVVSGLTTELEESREREAELAVAQERIRFASDLHDIQGHTLHVVKLKITLAEKLLRSDIGRVEEELREVRDLVGDTITQTRELAYAQRRLNLSAELENAKNLFRAAGIRVRVVREAEVDSRAGELLGQVLRETTTNILRHAEAEQVRITLSESGISIVNDGARGDALPDLRGLSTLRERVAGEGGELTVEQEDGRFLTAAAFPRLGSDTSI